MNWMECDSRMLALKRDAVFPSVSAGPRFTNSYEARTVVIPLATQLREKP